MKKPKLNRLLKVILLLSAAVVITSLARCFPARSKAPMIAIGPAISALPLVRVAVYESNAPDAGLTISLAGAYKLKGVSPDTAARPGSSLKDASVELKEGKFVLADKSLPYEAFCLQPVQDVPVRLGANTYRGSLCFYRQGRQGLLVVNELDLENYLAGVLPAEMPLYFPEEALKAQVIAARTYTLYQMLSAPNDHFDLRADVRSQVYQGLDGECPLSHRLVNQTRGLVLVYEWHLFPAYYHSCCGGHTTSPATAWGEEVILPLSGVKCGYCSNCKYAKWKTVIPHEELIAALGKLGISLNTISSIQPVATDRSGHIPRLLVAGSGRSFEVNVNELRGALGWRRLPSAAFSVQPESGAFVFQGRGFGHGVGMCQWGAKGAAEQGADALAVLQHYYPGCRVVKLEY